jgi:4-hydroxy-4-methyl-2-oxoglutarate aldolase
LALFGLDGWLTPPLLPIVPADQPTMGRAVTVELLAESEGTGLGPLHQLLSDELEGHVVVIAGGRPIGGAVWGEIMSRAARQQHVAAVLLDGYARDAPAMVQEGLPVYATALAIVGPAGRASMSRVGDPVAVGAVVVAPGDPVIVDASGAVRVPAADCERVLGAARTYALVEEQVMSALAAGEALVDAYRFKKSMVGQLTNEIAEWRRGR